MHNLVSLAHKLRVMVVLLVYLSNHRVVLLVRVKDVRVRLVRLAAVFP
jgi:hypothetical protein